MMTAEKKDVWYIAKQFFPLTWNFDLNKNCINIVAFDGAYNVQKAGDILREQSLSCRELNTQLPLS